MTETDFKPIVKAKELMTHSLILTSNSNRYPKKYRHSLCDRIQIKSFDIYERLLEANRTNINDRPLRCEEITKAIAYCDELSTYIELSMELGLLNAQSTEYWSKMVCDVKNLALAWRKTERNKIQVVRCIFLFLRHA